MKWLSECAGDTTEGRACDPARKADAVKIVSANRGFAARANPATGTRAGGDSIASRSQISQGTTVWVGLACLCGRPRAPLWSTGRKSFGLLLFARALRTLAETDSIAPENCDGACGDGEVAEGACVETDEARRVDLQQRGAVEELDGFLAEVAERLDDEGDKGGAGGSGVVIVFSVLAPLCGGGDGAKGRKGTGEVGRGGRVRDADIDGDGALTAEDEQVKSPLSLLGGSLDEDGAPGSTENSGQRLHQLVVASS
jgi:hypothetical protein